MSTLSKRQWVWAAVAVATAIAVTTALAALIFSALTVGAVRETQQNNTQTLDNSAETLRVVQDCTTSGGECFEQSQKRTAEAVGNINRVVILAAACAVGVDPKLSAANREARISACVIDRLARS